MKHNPLFEKIQKTGLLSPNDNIVVGVSGGSDSVFLLHALVEVKKHLPIFITAAHFNHGIRGEASDRDEQFTRSLCKKKGVPLQGEKWERPDGSFSEEEARKARYTFFEKVCEAVKADALALAHTRDDDAETILFRFLRGSGLLGLRGIPYTRSFGSFRIIRPLKEISKEEICSYLREKKISWCEDASNFDLRYTRNRIRHHLLPLLEKEFNPKIREGLVRFGRNVAEDYEYLQKEGDAAFEKTVLTEGKRSIVFKRKAFQTFPPAIQKQLFRQAVRRLGADMDEIGYSDWEMVVGYLGQKNFRCTLPGPLHVRGTPTKFAFQKEI